MSIIKWSEELSIGIEHIDRQHMELMATINELHLAVEYDKGPDLVLPIIDRLLDYAKRHFHDEEELLRQHEYPDATDHAAEHQLFIAKINELRDRYESDRQRLTINLRNFLLSWFFNHIKTEDMAYKHYIARKAEHREH